VGGSPINRILIPFDNSKHAARAFSFTLNLAKKFSASVSVISVVQEDLSRSWIHDTPGREKGMGKSSVEILQEKLKIFQEQAKKFGIKYDSSIITSSSVGESILTDIIRQKVDFVVMGTRGKAMDKEMMLGRISTQIALNANCPVLLVK
jgi:nucleotide-binding universal stress UspA family protein